MDCHRRCYYRYHGNVMLVRLDAGRAIRVAGSDAGTWYWCQIRSGSHNCRAKCLSKIGEVSSTLIFFRQQRNNRTFRDGFSPCLKLHPCVSYRAT
jgi:hypothetical protein